VFEIASVTDTAANNDTRLLPTADDFTEQELAKLIDIDSSKHVELLK
jgi:hypothetical protein